MTTFWLMLALAGPGSALAPTASPSPSFCARLAEPLKMKPPSLPERPLWRRDLMGSFGVFMFGGVSVVGVEVIAPEPRTVESIDRAGEMCKATAKGARCTVTAPFGFLLMNKTEEIRVTPDPGETAEVTVRGTVVECRDSRAAP